jgi:hypothetical protein
MRAKRPLRQLRSTPLVLSADWGYIVCRILFNLEQVIYFLVGPCDGPSGKTPLHRVMGEHFYQAAV